MKLRDGFVATSHAADVRTLDTAVLEEIYPGPGEVGVLAVCEQCYPVVVVVGRLPIVASCAIGSRMLLLQLRCVVDWLDHCRALLAVVLMSEGFGQTVMFVLLHRGTEERFVRQRTRRTRNNP